MMAAALDPQAVQVVAGGTNGRCGRNCGRASSIVSLSNVTRTWSPALPLQMANRWQPTLAIQASLALHAGAAIVVLARPHLWPWCWRSCCRSPHTDRSRPLAEKQAVGPNWTHLPIAAAANGSVAITIDDGPDPAVTPKVLDLLDQHCAKATFFCIGELVEQHSSLAREIVSRGHSIENHSQHHLHRFSVLGPGAITAEIARAQDTIEAVTGERPRFFRAPAGLRSPSSTLCWPASGCASQVGREEALTPSTPTRPSCSSD